MRIKRILAIRTDRFGEFLLNIPALRALKRLIPEGRLILAAGPQVSEIVRCIDCIDDLVIWENRKHSFSEMISFAALLRGKKIDLCVVLNPSKEINICAFLAGIPVRVGYAKKWGFLLNRTIPDKKHSGEKHEIESNLDLVGLVGAKGSREDLYLALSGECAKVPIALEPLQDFVVIHPWTSDPVKQWPAERFFVLAKRIVDELKIKVVFVGGKNESEAIDGYKSYLNSDMTDLTGKTNLVELAATIKKSCLLVSCDSGPVHLASCVATPSLVIFRNDLSGKKSGRWGPVSAGSAVIENSDLSKIDVDSVFTQVKIMLNKTIERGSN